MLPTEIAQEPVLITTGKTPLTGVLNVPLDATAVVILANGLGRMKHAITESFAVRLNDAGLATMAVDLLTPDELQFDSRTGHFSSDSKFQSERFRDVVAWLRENPSTYGLPVVAAASGSAARGALRAAAEDASLFRALVIDGGVRPSDVPAGLRVPAIVLMQDDPVEVRRAQNVVEAFAGPTEVRVIPSADAARSVHPLFCDAAAKVTTQWLTNTIE